MLLLNRSCLISELPEAQMAFADPPDNISLGYDSYHDKLTNDEYEEFIDDVICIGTGAPTFWLSFNARHTAMVGYLVHSNFRHMEVKPCVNVFTFGNYQSRDLTNCYRPLWRFRRLNAPLYPEAIKVPSWRQLNGDKRAAEGGRVPGDVFEFPRVTGNSKQRRAWHPTQLHEDLYERCIKLCCKPGDTVVDMFAGTGTLARVADRCGINAIMIEKSRAYCEKIAEEHNLSETDGVWT